MRRLVVGLAIGFATLTPTWALANDQQIAQQIIQKLEQQKQAGQLKGFGIDLQVNDGTVFMNGRVNTPEQQQMALSIAQRTPGVKEVVNGLKVGEGVVVAGGVDTTAGGVQQVANHEPVRSVMKRPASKAAGSYTSETGSGARIPTASRISQSQLVAAQEPVGYSPMMTAPEPGMPVSMPGQMPRSQMPYPVARTNGYAQPPMAAVPGGAAPVPYAGQGPAPAQMASGVGVAPARYDHPHMPGYAWPSYAAYPNYSAVTYPKQYSPTAWPYIGPFYPYPQVPLGWRKVTLEWDDGWWMLDFKDQSRPWKPYR